MTQEGPFTEILYNHKQMQHQTAEKLDELNEHNYGSFDYERTTLTMTNESHFKQLCAKDQFNDSTYVHENRDLTFKTYSMYEWHLFFKMHE